MGRINSTGPDAARGASWTTLIWIVCEGSPPVGHEERMHLTVLLLLQRTVRIILIYLVRFRIYLLTSVLIL